MEVGFLMAKYNYELKKKIVTAYLKGEGGYKQLAKKYDINNKKTVQLWVNNYNELGDEALMRSRKNEKYSFEKKLFIVELYLTSEISYRELAIQEGITNPSMIANWVKRFRTAGSEALRPQKKGRKKTLDKTKKPITKEETAENTIDTNVEHVKELKEELLRLRIENAFLKELRRLRLEDEAKMREWHSSLAASEENSN